MKKYLLLAGVCLTILTLFQGDIFAQTGWKQQKCKVKIHSNFVVNFHGVFFSDSINGFAVGGNDEGGTGIIILTTDGGETWQQQKIGNARALWGVCFKDANNGTAVGDAQILHTVDGGETWDKKTKLTYARLYGVTYADSVTVIAVGSSGVILRSTDGGDTWTTQKKASFSGFDLYGVSFTDAKTGTAVGKAGKILRTTDGGETWKETPKLVNGELRSVCFTEANTGTVVGGNMSMNLRFLAGKGEMHKNDGFIFRTTDGGANWTKQLGKVPYLQEVAFVNANTGVAVGIDGTILRTSNGGEIWTKQKSGKDKDLYGVTLASENKGWVVGGELIILHTATGGE